jgi:hypothetical protein
MSIDKTYGRKVPKHVQPGNASGINITPGVYEAVVKNVIDSTRSGRLQVWIPELGSGDQTKSENWYTVSYASPFMGMTYQPDDASKLSTFSKVRHTYGFWAVPPDIGNTVLVMFIAGDPNRGYWFACTLNKLGHSMLPAIGGDDQTGFDKDAIEDADLKKALMSDSNWPLAELNEIDGTNVVSEFMTIKKPPHEFQTKRYIVQGLDRDKVRGAPDSSGQRNIPSATFGWSTPGRPLNDPIDKEGLAAKVESGEANPKDLEVLGRKGGHSFVMDDGDFYGKSQMMRFRTSAGHQILMDDSNKTFYIINSEGSCWIEMPATGQLNIFSSGGLNLRSRGDINMHSDQSVKIHAAANFKVYAGQQIDLNSATTNILTSDFTKIYGSKVEIGSSGGLNMSCGGLGSFKAGGELKLTGSKVLLNSGPGPEVTKPAAIPLFSLDDTGLNSANGLWEIKTDALASIVNIAPTHEPWGRFSGTSQADKVAGTSAGSGGATTGRKSVTDGPAPTDTIAPTDCAPSNVVKDGSGNPVKDGNGNFVTSGEEKLDPGPASVKNTALPAKKQCPKSFLAREDTPNPPGGVGTLNQLQVKAVMTALGFSESGFNYKAINPYNYVGKYQFGAPALVDRGYIKLDYYKQYRNAAVKEANAWTGEGGIRSLSDYFNSSGTQEKVMYDQLVANYKRMLSNGAIKGDDTPCTVAGMLCVAHLLGPNTGTERNPGAKGWRQTGGGQDANGTTGGTYFNLGKYAIDVLAAPTTG